VVQSKPCLFDKSPSRIRKRNQLVIALKKGKAKPIFELCYLFRYGGLGDSQPISSSRKIQFFCQGDHRFHQPNLVPRHSRPPTGIGESVNGLPGRPVDSFGEAAGNLAW